MEDGGDFFVNVEKDFFYGKKYPKMLGRLSAIVESTIQCSGRILWIVRTAQRYT